MSSKASILEKMRRQLGRTTHEVPAAVKQRLASRESNLIPAKGRHCGEAMVQGFVTMATLAKARVERLPSAEAALEAMAKEHQGSLFLSDEIARMGLPLTQLGFEVGGGEPSRDGAVVVTSAFAGIAETGTLMMVCEKGHPHTLNILGAKHYVLLPLDRVVPNYEAAQERMRQQRGEDFMPRITLWVTGPSRTGDIEQTMQLGAHGPKQLIIYLIDTV